MQAAIDSGKQIPGTILNAPEISIESFFFWNAFIELNTCRGDHGIPWTAIDAYARRYNVKDEIFEDLLDIIRALDDVMSKHKEQEMSKNNGSR